MTARLLLLMGCTMLLISCGGGDKAGGAGEIDLPAFEAELAVLSCPEGVDPALWLSLKDEFRSVMGRITSGRAAAVAPETELSAVNDFKVIALPTGIARLEWTYRNQGDYNQDKLVAVTDLTEVGRYFEVGQDDTGWETAQLADGNNDGRVTVSDITPLGVNYERRVEGYRVYAGTTPGVAANWEALADLPFADGAVPEGDQRLSFEYVVDDPVDQSFYRVVPYDGEHEGIAGNAAQFNTVAPMVSVQVPEVMQGGEEAQWIAEWVQGTPPYEITWEFGGGADDIGPIEVQGSSSEIETYGADVQDVLMINDDPLDSANYSYTVTVTDDYGLTGTAVGEYTVGPNPSPQITVTVPDDMAGHQLADWTAEWIGGVAPCTIAWEFGGGAEDIAAAEATSPDEQQVIMLNDSETESADYTYSVTVTDSLGNDGVSEGEYTVGPLEPMIVTVDVPDNMRGGLNANWHASWTAGAPPFEVSWEFGGGSYDHAETWGGFERYRRTTMFNSSRIKGAQYTYTVTITDSLGSNGVASGDYTVGPDPHPLITVTVPDNMFGEQDAAWEAEWIGGTGPFTIEWEFHGGADDIDPYEASSPALLLATMFNPSMTEDTQYSYSVTVENSEGFHDAVSGEYTVGPGPNLPPEITLAAFEFATSTLLVEVDDLNTDESVTVTVTEPAGWHVDETEKSYPSGHITAEFSWTADEPVEGKTGMTHVAAEDSQGATAETDALLAMLLPDTLYAIPLKTQVQVDEPVIVVVASGVLPNPFRDASMISLTVEPGAQFGDSSPGTPGGDGEDGIWSPLGTSTVHAFSYLGDNGDGLQRLEVTLLPFDGTEIIGAAGSLFCVECTFDSPGTYTFGFKEITGIVKRTYYTDYDEYEYSWGDISNTYAGVPNSIVVVE